MKSFLDAEVSLFNNVKSKLPIKTITLREWLFRDNSDLRKKVDDIRTSEGEEKRDLKESIFCITGSGIFNNGRSDEKIVKHNGNIIIDIDYKDNTDLDNNSAVEAENYDLSEILIGDTIDVGELVTQYLSLAIKPYPRSKEADIHMDNYHSNTENDGCFAILKTLIKSEEV